ncbi:hypothetical protein IVA98_26075 [Bradyrhizobium sp. 160]|uniref:hypothetical protein n=1 Tax=Bradyrhizobium sp. 160 TaxID=2782634 RepID=UPI001FF73D04|nr:hypothetical protein [Bradyrhizobium sp. 160]MCK1626564.1 hypothetical protein [Bradyrhizobium sp. 160]
MIRLGLVLFTLMTVDAALAAPRQVTVLVEEPYLDPDDPPTKEQADIAADLKEVLARRILEIQIEHHVTVDGTAAPSTALNSADLIFQVLLTVGQKGFRYQAQLYERVRNTWIRLDSRLLKTASPETLGKAISDDVLPALVVRVHEVAQGSDRPILFADCVFAPSTGASGVEPLAWSVSQRYPTQLSGNATLIHRFGVIRLVPPFPNDYQWWCVQLQRPRLGSLRSDTLTVHGSIEQLSPGKPEVFIVVSSRDRNLTSRETIPLDLQDWPAFLKRVTETVEGLLNEK